MIAERLGHHPTELALIISLAVSLLLTLGIVLTERARPHIKGLMEKIPLGATAYVRIEGALVLLFFALLGVLGGASIFLHIVEALQEAPALARCDQLFVDTVHRTASHAEVMFFSMITPLAGVYPPLILGVLVACWLVYRREKLLAWIWAAGLIGNSLLIQGLKLYFQRERPVFEAPILVENNFSFPSGHAMTSILLYGLLAYVLSRQVSRYGPVHRHFIVWVVTFLGMMIGTSRLVLGVHYPSDVVAGWSVAIAWLGCLVLLAEMLRGRFRHPR